MDHRMKLIAALILATGCASTAYEKGSADSFCVHHTQFMAEIDKCTTGNAESEEPRGYEKLRDSCFDRVSKGESMWDLAKEYRTQEQDMRLLTGCGV